MSRDPTITRLLREQRDRPDAAEELYRAVLGRLRRLARGRLRGAGAGGTLDTTALVNEAYLRLADPSPGDWNDRNHFFAVAATAMRQIVVDEARRKASQKRGGGLCVTVHDDEHVGRSKPPIDVIDLDRALGRLERIDPRLCRVVELKFFAGCTTEEAAQALGSSERTVKRDWRKARALLYAELGGPGEPPAS